MTQPGTDAIAAAFLARMRMLGADVPEEWLTGVLAVHRELAGMAALLHAYALPAELEPAPVFRLAPPAQG